MRLARLTILTALLLSFRTDLPLYANTFGKYAIQKESKIWIEGSSTVNEFTCLTYKIDGIGVLDTNINAAPIVGAPLPVALKANFSVVVTTMDCGNKMMNSDMYNALKSDEHKYISYELKKVQLTENGNENGSYEAITLGTLSVAGKQIDIKMKVKLTQLAGNKYKVEGSKDILMSAFGVTPPTAMMGLIKAHDKLTFHIDIVVSG